MSLAYSTINTSDNKNVISGRELISYVREAYAFQDKVFLTLFDRKVACEIISFRDPDIRDTDLDREIDILLPSNERLGLPPRGELIQIEVLSKQMRLLLHCVLIRENGEKLALRLPAEGTLLDVRKKSRFSLSDLGWHDAVVFSDSMSAPCVLKVTDITASGTGARIISQVPVEQLGLRLKIETRVTTEAFVLNGPYNVIRITPECQSEKSYEYTIAFSNEMSVSTASDNSRAQRHAAKTTFKFRIAVINGEAEFEIDDVSISGFKGRVKTYRSAFLTKGMVVTEETTGLRFRVARLQGDGAVGFELMSSKIEERIRWLNQILPVLSNGRVEVNVDDARSLLNLFFEAGASIVDGLDYKRYRLTEEDALKLLTVRSDILMRWINLSETGRLLGHQSAYRVGVNSWYTGDIVGGQTATNRADRGFFKSNLRFLRELVERFDTEQKIMGSWKPNHPYWQDWRNFIIKSKAAYSMELCDSVGRDQIDALVKTDDARFQYSALSGKALYQHVGALSEGKQHFLAALDVYSTADCSNGIKELYQANGKPTLRRELYILNYEGQRYVILFSHLPTGISLNPNFDSAFVFPIDDQQLTPFELKQFYSNVVCFGSRRGFRLASVRYFSEKIRPLGTLTEFFVINSEGMGCY